MKPLQNSTDWTNFFSNCALCFPRGWQKEAGADSFCNQNWPFFYNYFKMRSSYHCLLGIPYQSETVQVSFILCQRQSHGDFTGYSYVGLTQYKNRPWPYTNTTEVWSNFAFQWHLIVFTFVINYSSTCNEEMKYRVFYWFITGISIPYNSFWLLEIFHHLNLECFGTNEISQEEISKVVFNKETKPGLHLENTQRRYLEFLKGTTNTWFLSKTQITHKANVNIFYEF